MKAEIDQSSSSNRCAPRAYHVLGKDTAIVERQFGERRNNRRNERGASGFTILGLVKDRPAAC
jgi:hypothetical protein